jgi:hypothetical protein
MMAERPTLSNSVNNFRSKGLFGRQIAISLALFLLALMPRVPGLKVFLTPDEVVMIGHSALFSVALLTGDFAAAHTGDVPAITTFWAGTGGLIAKYIISDAFLGKVWMEKAGLLAFLQAVSMDSTNIDNLVFVRLPMALITSACVVAIYILVYRSFGNPIAVFSGVLVSLDPYYLAHSRLIHHDALTATFVALSVLSFTVYALERRSWVHLGFSGFSAGLAFLTKASSLLLVPFVGLLALVTWIRALNRRQGVGKEILHQLLALTVWAGVAGLTFVFLWPAMWADPIGTLGKFVALIRDSVLAPQRYHGRFFILGQSLHDPGPFFYLANLIFHLTPVTLLGLFLCLFFLRNSCRRILRRKSRGDLGNCWNEDLPLGTGGANHRIDANSIPLLLWVFLFTLFMTVSTQKDTRYLLPVYPLLDILAAVGIYKLMDLVLARIRTVLRKAMSEGRLLSIGLLVVLVWQALSSLPHYPYYLTFYNPLAGGARLAPRILEVGWGEGLDQAARYLNEKTASEGLKVASWYGGFSFGPFFKGQLENQTLHNIYWKDVDYVVLYVNQVQRQLSDPQLVRCFRSLKPEHIVHIGGIDYAWIYKVPRPLPECALPVQHAQRTQFEDKILLLGYEIVEDRIPFDGRSRINLYWRALREMEEDCTIYLKVINDAYHVWGQQDSRPVWDGSPTNSWQEGQVVGDKREIEILPATPPGLYWVEVIVQDIHSGRGLRTEDGGSVLLGPIEIPEQKPPPSIDSLDVEHPLQAVWGGKIRLLGYNIESGFRPGDNIHLALFWQCLEPMGENYTVFIHLGDGAQKIWGQKDNQPVDNFYPTTKWETGQIIRDQYDLTLSPQAPSGQYQLEVGMYLAETGERLRVWDGSSEADKVLLNEIEIRP